MKANNLVVTELIQATREELLKARYTDLSLKLVERVWSNLEKYMQSKGIVYFSKSVGMDFLEERYHYSANPVSHSNLDRLRAIELLADFQAHERILIRRRSEKRKFAQPFRTTFHEFMEFRKSTGISSRTLESYLIYLDRFSNYLVDHAVTELSEIKVTHIYGFIQSTAAAHRTSTVYCTSCLLRVLFRYLYIQQLIPKNLALFVLSVKCSKKSKIPSAYTQEEIQKMLSCIDCGNPKGKRDYAMLLIDVDDALRGSRIQVRYNPFDLWLIQVWKDGIRYADAKAAELRSQRHKKLPVDDPKPAVPTPVASYVERLKQEQEAKKREALGTTSFARLKTRQDGGEGTC